MSSLARILLDKLQHVSGSDVSASPITDDLIRRGADISIGHSKEHISSEKIVVISSDIKQDNPELLEALRLKCEVLHRSDLLFRLMQGHKTLAVTGTHGKTTTTSLLGWVLCEGEFDPSLSVGGIAKNFASNARQGKGPFFVAEADESDGTFTKYKPYGAIITNIGLDHMSHFMTEEKLCLSYGEFITHVESSDHLFWCGDDRRLRTLTQKGTSYGYTQDCALKALNFSQQGWNSFFDVAFEGKTYARLEIPLTGKHNVLNALAVFGMALKIGVSEAKIRQAFQSFKGVARRCEVKGEKGGVLFLDDYAHHPTEIASTLRAIKNAAPERRLIAIYQPHRYSRTKDCLGSYGTIFDAADEVVITEIYSAGEAPIQGVHTGRIVEEVKCASAVSCRHLPLKELPKWVLYQLRADDIVVTLGAGSITKTCTEIMRLIY